MKNFSILFLLITCGFAKFSFAQNPSPEFDFSYQWGTYGHFKVSSKETKVFIKVKHPDVYADTTIYFTKADKAQIWKKLQEINFFNYPDDYNGCDFESDFTPDFSVFYKHNFNKETGIIEIDSTSADTIWELAPIYNCGETTIPYAEYSISIFMKDKIKTINWNGGIKIYRIEKGKNVYIDNPKYNNLIQLGNLIRKITENKQGFKNLPESNLEYY